MKTLLLLSALTVLVAAQTASDKDITKGQWWLNATERDKSIYIMGFSDGLSHAGNIVSLTGRLELVESYASCLDSTSVSEFSVAITKYIRAHNEASREDRMLVVMKAFTNFCESQPKK